MSSIFKKLRAGPPPPKVALLPDGLFFTRAVPVAAGATAAEAAAQAELALEGLSPFPAAQLYHGFFWLPGAERALVFAAYRRRFTAEQTAEWGSDALVLPAFAALLGTTAQPATTLLVPSADGLTAVHWDGGPVPAKILFRPLAPEAPEADRAAARDSLLRECEGSLHVIELATPPAPESSRTDTQLVFRSGEWVSRLPAATAAALDVRDKTELVALRRARARDVMLWRVVAGATLALLFLGLGEALIGGGWLWERSRLAVVRVQRPPVEQIRSSQLHTARINELSTKRLLPIDMILLVSGPKPATIWFNKAVATTEDINKLVLVDTQTTSLAEIAPYRTAVAALPQVASAEISGTRASNNQNVFTLTVTFKPGVLKSAEAAP